MSFQCAAEQAAWREVKEGWRPLYGDVDSMGVAVEWHDFQTARSFNWGRTFHPRSLEFCLNLEGHGEVGAAAKAHYAAAAAGYYAIGDEPLPASRRANDRHQFATLEFSRNHLQKQFVQNEGDLEPQIRRVIFGDKDETVVGPTRPMSIEQRAVIANLASPPVSKAAQILWYQSKALELMAHFLFEPKDPEFFCQRQKRVARERVERAKELLSRDLANPLTLEMLGQEVGCSPFYLSRMFSREVGLTIPQYLRKLRMERAAELLRTGRYNVTEAATEVGYSSLSHFSKAFCETIGCCPVLYPAAKNVITDR
ncbi:MAG TPA: AraC family transcriptional regulator [Chthoniobacterales bacterium]|jgi:AraC family transcriptional regulator|nr:AraC family transcriptional regulator [Chthoniobacterales bacterium]